MTELRQALIDDRIFYLRQQMALIPVRADLDSQQYGQAMCDYSAWLAECALEIEMLRHGVSVEDAERLVKQIDTWRDHRRNSGDWFGTESDRDKAGAAETAVAEALTASAIALGVGHIVARVMA